MRIGVSAFCVSLFMALVASRGVSQVTMKSLPIVCSDQLANAWANYEAHPGNTVPISSQIDLTQGNAATCLQALVKDTTDSTARQLAPNIRAAPESLLSAVANYSPQVQQGATTSSTAVVSPISKLIGLQFHRRRIRRGKCLKYFQFHDTQLIDGVAAGRSDSARRFASLFGIVGS